MGGLIIRLWDQIATHRPAMLVTTLEEVGCPGSHLHMLARVRTCAEVEAHGVAGSFTGDDSYPVSEGKALFYSEE